MSSSSPPLPAWALQLAESAAIAVGREAISCLSRKRVHGGFYAFAGESRRKRRRLGVGDDRENEEEKKATDALFSELERKGVFPAHAGSDDRESVSPAIELQCHWTPYSMSEFMRRVRFQLAEEGFGPRHESRRTFASGSRDDGDDDGDGDDIVETLPGTPVLRAVWNQLHCYRQRPDPHQEAFQAMVLNVFLPVIYSARSRPGALTDWDRHSERIRRYTGLNQAVPLLGVVCSMPRQFGKTTCIAMLIAALMAYVPGFSVISVSTTMRISALMSEEVMKFIKQIPGAEERICKHNLERLVMRTAPPASVQSAAVSSSSSSAAAAASHQGGQMRRAMGERAWGDFLGAPLGSEVEEAIGGHGGSNSHHGNSGGGGGAPVENYDDDTMYSNMYTLPSGSDKLRGLRALLLIVDEAAFANKKMFNDFLMPLLRVGGRKLVAISTPAKTALSIFSQWMDDDNMARIEKDFGANAFLRYKLDTMCPDCSRERLAQCPHRQQYRPSWESAAQCDMASRVMASVDPDAANRELRGATTDRDVPVFSAPHVRLIFQKDRWWNPTSVERSLTAAGISGSSSIRGLSHFHGDHWSPRTVFIAIDPSGGGIGSDTAIVSFFFTPFNECVVRKDTER